MLHAPSRRRCPEPAEGFPDKTQLIHSNLRDVPRKRYGEPKVNNQNVLHIL